VGQSYEVFYYLAGMRGSGGWNAKPIAEPRGLPEDFEFFTPKASDCACHNDVYHTYDVEGKKYEVWMGDHTMSHLTLLELQTERNKILPSRFLTEEQFALWDNFNDPAYMFGLVEDDEDEDDATVVDESCYKALSEWLLVYGVGSIPMKIKVSRKCHPLTWVVRDIQMLQPNVDPADLRLVFGFDN
jgi:hypothetical protein